MFTRKDRASITIFLFGWILMFAATWVLPNWPGVTNLIQCVGLAAMIIGVGLKLLIWPPPH